MRQYRRHVEKVGLIAPSCWWCQEGSYNSYTVRCGCYDDDYGFGDEYYGDEGYWYWHLDEYHIKEDRLRKINSVLFSDNTEHILLPLFETLEEIEESNETL